MKFILFIRILLFVFALQIIGKVNLIAASNVVNANGKMIQKNGFIENKGQIIDQKNNPNPAVLYLLNTPGMNVQLRRGGFSYDLYSPTPNPSPKRERNPLRGMQHDSIVNYPLSIINYHRIDINLEGANPNCQIIASEPLTEYFNYFTANVPPEGIKDVRQYSRITYKDIYPDIDLVFFTTGDHGYEYNFVIRPGGNINDIWLTIEGPDLISLFRDTLKFGTRFGDVEELIPESYYMVNNSRVDIQARFKRIDNEVYGFSINKQVPERSVIVIDPTSIRLWGTYYGGSGGEGDQGCAADKYGNVFISGNTNSTNNIASNGSYQDTLGGNYDGFLVKFNAAGWRQWGTYFGGSDLDEAFSCVVDNSGNIYVSGDTKSTSGIATPGTHQSVFGGPLYDCYVEKFNTNGTRLWGTYYGGESGDYGGSLAVDHLNNIYLTGWTSSDTGIASAGAYQTSRYGTLDAFLAKFDSNGVRQWGTYYGGEHNDYGQSCATDGAGNIYFCGYTASDTNIASQGGYQKIYGGGLRDAFLAKFTTGGQRIWATYYGGSLDDEGYGCAADSAGNVCLVGRTNSANGIASNGCFQPTLGGNYDGYIVKFDSSGQRQWGTYYGGTNTDQAYSCAFGWGGDIFMAGNTLSSNNIATLDSYQPGLIGIGNGMLVKFNSAGQRQWGTYYGGGDDDFYSCSYVVDDTLYAEGLTSSTNNIASPGAWQEVYGGGMSDAMLIKFLDCWPIDTAGPINGPINVCKPSTGVNYSIPPIAHAVDYIWTIPSGFTITSGAGTQDITVDINNSAISGLIGVQVLNKCNSGATAYLSVTVGQAPFPTISGPNNTCAGTGKVYTTDPGKTNYQWSVSAGGLITSGGTNTDNTVTVTWNAIGTQHVYVNYTDANGCSADTPADYPVTVTPSPAVSISITASPSNNVCSGTQVTFTATPTNGGGNPLYQWMVNGINAGTDSPTFIYSPVNNDAVKCLLTSSISGCIMNNPANSNAITMIVNPILAVSLSISASSNPFCQGSMVTFTATPTNEGTTPGYQWKVNGVSVGPNNSVYSYIPSNGDIVSCVLNSSVPCPTGNPATSNTITMTEDNNVVVSVSITPSLNPVCAGTSVTFTAAAVNGGSAPVYQWKVNGINVGTNNPTYSYIPVNGDLVTCMLTSNAACASGNPATSNIVTMTVNPNLPVSVSVIPSQNPVCAANIVTFTATPTNGGLTPSYQWKVNGVGVGTNSPNYSYVPNNGDTVTCVMTSDATCPTGNPATSAPITMTVNPNLAVSVTVSASANPFCQGSSVTFTAVAINEGALPIYQWKVNGVSVGTNSSSYTYNPTNGDLVSCILTSSIPCPINNPITSNTLLMTVNNNLPAGVTITASSNPFCPGSSVTFTATPINGGLVPAYQWKVNGVNAGINSHAFTYNVANGDSIRCVMTSNLSCVTNNPASSTEIIMSGTLAPIVTFTSCFDTITTVNAKPIKLKGGIPLNGTYSGPGVNSLTGVFTPSVAGTGTKTVTYTYTNAAMCSANKSIHIIVQTAPAFTCGNSITDIRDNKVYPTVQIGGQCWLASNLNYGTVLVSSQDQRDNCISEKYCYNDNPVNCTNQGGLYQWDELMQYDATPADQGFCPPAWHIPTENDWNTLFANYINNGFAGSPLKYSGYSGFNALLSGTRHIDKSWDFQGFATFFWSSTAYGGYNAWTHGMNDPDPSVSVYPASRANAFSVRCTHD
jgi:uncharacterized protein (TIGR02145 family)